MGHTSFTKPDFFKGLNPFSSESGCWQHSIKGNIAEEDIPLQTSFYTYWSQYGRENTLTAESLKLFNFIYGTHIPQPGTKGQKGLLDLCIFPLISRRLLVELNEPKVSYGMYFMALFILPLEVLRVALAAVLTLFMVPVLWLTQTTESKAKSKDASFNG